VAQAPELAGELRALGLLAHPERVPAGRPSLGELCASGALDGGLSVSLDVRPDELLGPLCLRIGGEARVLRVVDVRSSPPELWVQGGRGEEHWPVPDVAALVKELNVRFRDAAQVRAIALLGEWEEARQLWCIPKPALAPLLARRRLRARDVPGLAGGGRRSL